MSNPNKPFGFQLITTGGNESRVSYYRKESSAEIFPGDTLELNADGTVGLAETGEAIIGVSAGYSAAATTDELPVYDDPSAEFIVQSNGDFQLADIGQNADITTTTGDTDLYRSKQAIDKATYNTTSTLQWKLLGLWNQSPNAVGSYAIVRVKPNNHILSGGAGTTGV